ncbi:hypothetical protein HYW87_04355 [Candidatus Roizmanbacteria bacterium]|nr:hypothetical protein [Candidatus Roizmanbacteria bacterium]
MVNAERFDSLYRLGFKPLSAHQQSPSKPWFLEGIFPKAPEEILGLAETYMSIVVNTANHRGISVDFARSGLLRKIKPNPQIDQVRQRFGTIFSLQGIRQQPSAHRLIKSLATLGPNDFDVKIGSNRPDRLFTEEDESLANSILFDSALSLFGGLAIREPTIEETGILSRGTIEEQIKNKRRYVGKYIDETVDKDWKHMIFDLPNEILIDVSFGERAGNKVGEIIFSQHGRDAFVIHLGSHAYDERKTQTDTRSGARVSSKAQLATPLLVNSAPPLRIDEGEIHRLLEIVNSPGHIESSSIPPDSQFASVIHQALRELRINGGFYIGEKSDSAKTLIKRMFDRYTWGHLRKIFNKATELLKAGELIVSPEMESNYVKDILVMLEASPYRALVGAIMTDNLRIFPFFREVPVYYFYDLLTSDAFTFEMVQDPNIASQRTYMPKYRRNWSAVLRSERLWERSDVDGIKLFWLAVINQSRDLTNPQLTLPQLGKLIDKQGALALESNLRYDEYRRSEANHIDRIRDAAKAMYDFLHLAEANPELKSQIDKVLRILEGFTKKRERSTVALDSLLEDLNVDDVFLPEIRSFFYRSGIMTPLGSPDSNLCTFTPPSILDSIWQKTSKLNLWPKVEKVVKGRIYSNRVLKQKAGEAPKTAVRYVVNKGIRPTYARPEAALYYPPSNTQLSDYLNEVLNGKVDKLMV